MQKLTVSKSILSGSIQIPPSKSQSHRALLFGAMASGTTTIHHLLKSPDTDGMISALKILGADIQDNNGVITIDGLNGKINGADHVIDVGNSGIALRFLSGLAMLSDHPIVITGDHSICHQRPMNTLINSLNQLGAHAISIKNEGFAPLMINGPIANHTVTLNGKDSQPVSALLLSSIFAPHSITIHVETPGELPWIDLTLSWLDRLGVRYTREGYSTYQVEGNNFYSGFDYHVPGDHSSAAFPLAAALVTGSELILQNIDMNDLQGDKRIITILQEMGADITINDRDKTLHVAPNQQLHGITVDINDCIDTISILATIACFASGETHMTNAAVAKEKECDRIECIAKELAKMGAKITPTQDGLMIRGGDLTGADVNSHDDHRMAMSLAVAGLGASGKTIVNHTACIAKTYPTFVEDLKRIGANL